TFETSPVLKDSDSVAKNSGSIYKVAQSSETKITLLDTLPTISGTGTAVFGVVIDNIYAPGATATIQLIQKGETVEGSTKDLSGNDSTSTQTHASSAEEYKSAGSNQYID
ncbi:MAG: hypothetical protein ACI38A_10955, partial [Candidatus Ornithomonoglobus sp.]